MAELTANEMDVVLDRLGGLRKMADNVNLKVSNLYADELHTTANIIAVDFVQGTWITEMAVYFNSLLG